MIKSGQVIGVSNSLLRLYQGSPLTKGVELLVADGESCVLVGWTVMSHEAFTQSVKSAVIQCSGA